MQAAPIALSPLDSERFGVVVARVDGVSAAAVPALLVFCEQHRVELLIARCDGADVAAAKALTATGLVALESQITYRAPLSSAWDPDIREGVAGDRDAVAELARAGFGDLAGHYHADPRLDPDSCAEGYVDWTLRGLAGEAADVFYLADLGGRPAAYGMFRQEGAEAVFLLATVDASARGRGLYVALLHHGMAWAEERGAETMIGIVTHSNIAPQRNLIAAGFRPVASTTTFHGWMLDHP
jgi:ribosomal protein S18 acetylase RimI-like enzyme